MSNFRFIGAAMLSLVVSARPAFAMEVDPALTQALRSNSSGKLSVLVHLDGQVDINDLNHLDGTSEQKAKAIANILEKNTKESSHAIVKYLRSPNVRGVEEITYLWITNSLRIKASSQIVEKLMAMNGIESLMLDAPKEIFELGTSTASAVPGTTDAPETAWGVKQLKAPELWEQGITGKGITVAVIDSGANLTHPDLEPNLWQNPGETGKDSQGRERASNGVDDDGNGFIDDVVGWNFEEKTNTPSDEDGHGSQTAGIVGGNGVGGTKTGVAPGAKLMILRSCCSTGTEVFESNTWEAMQYAIKNGARVISMSLSVKHPSKPSYAKWRRASEVMLAANVVHINSAGNRGSFNLPFNIGAPASNPPAWYHPKQTVISGMTSMITIGATDDKDVLRSYSSTGPVTWENVTEYKDFPYEGGKKPGLVKPDVCGPSEVPSTAPDGKGYTKDFGGTSSATPHIGGVAALLLSAYPKLTVAQVTEALQMSAVKVESEFNNKCGAGRVDALAAVEYAKTKF